MPKCINCSKKQSKLKAGSLCKKCFNSDKWQDDNYIISDNWKIDDTGDNEDLNKTSYENSIIGNINDHSTYDSKREFEYAFLLKEQIVF